MQGSLPEARNQDDQFSLSVMNRANEGEDGRGFFFLCSVYRSTRCKVRKSSWVSISGNLMVVWNVFFMCLKPTQRSYLSMIDSNRISFSQSSSPCRETHPTSLNMTKVHGWKPWINAVTPRCWKTRFPVESPLFLRFLSYELFRKPIRNAR